MKQVTQKLKDGQIRLLEVPSPSLREGMILVQNHYSLISTGTESSTVSAARQSLLGKAQARPQQVRQVLRVLQQQGMRATYRAVMKKLDSYSPLGYSSAGEIIDLCPSVQGFQKGDLVACAGGGYASHAEIVSVPATLCVKLSPQADLEKAAYNTLGAIALQGVRQAGLVLGESCVVIGLGLIGQLSALLLQAAGVRVIGIDINPDIVEEVHQGQKMDLAFSRWEENLISKIYAHNLSEGVDAVIIAASTKSDDPINLAGSLLRKRGQVVVLGEISHNFQRDPDYYRKELSLKMSCSYGPGRYDPNYEEKGQDYPIAYVRWTENRNMEAFQDLVQRNKIDPGILTTHRFDLEKVAQAYEMILQKKKTHLGVLIRYSPQKRETVPIVNLAPRKTQKKYNLGFLGAGSYAQSYLLPFLAHEKQLSLKTVVTNSGLSARSVGEKFSFENCTCQSEVIFQDEEIDTVFIASRHNSHANYVLESLRQKKNIFVEKPLCLKLEELEEIRNQYQKTPTYLMIGFNRRYAPLTQKLKKYLDPRLPISALYRINAGSLSPDSWILDPEVGGGRVLAEFCHFVDLLTYLSASTPFEVSASALRGEKDTIQVQITFSNGSVASLVYLTNGSSLLSKEYLEIHQANTSAVLNDFKSLTVYGAKKKTWNMSYQDKGQKEMLRVFWNDLQENKSAPINFSEIYIVTLTVFRIIEAIQTREAIAICPKAEKEKKNVF